jgi:hypothetical protein
MGHNAVQSILEQVRNLDRADRVRLADELDRLTWRDRVETLLADVAARRGTTDPIADAEIDRLVDEVRSEKSLYERYWTRRQRSAP